MIRLTLLTEIPAPYRIPIFNALSERDDVELEVMFLRERHPGRPYPLHADEMRFSWRVLRGRHIARGGHWLIFNVGVAGALRRTQPDVVVLGGWNQPAFWRALLWARLRRTPAVLWVESTAADARIDGRWPSIARRLALRLAAAFLVPGGASRAYLRSLGVADGHIVTAPNAVDLAVFADAVDAARADRSRLRKKLGLQGPVALYAGRLDPEKGLDVLLDAMRDLPATLVLAGSGSLADELQAQAADGVRFAGQLTRDELVPWYAAADMLVLPSRSEPWGMILNEGATAGLPLVATCAAGAAHDLIEDGVNGFRVETDDPGALARALSRLVEDPAFRQRASARSRELAAAHAPSAWADAVAALAARLPRPR